MRNSNVPYYTLLLVRKGRSPLRIPIQPLPAILGLCAVLGAPAFWAGSTLYSLHQRNQTLSQSANQVLKELEVLDREVESLRQQAGLSHQNNPPAAPAPAPSRGKTSLRGQGGLGRQYLKTEKQLQLATQQLPSLSAHWQYNVKPALEDMLKSKASRQAAHPKGKPIRGVIPMTSGFGPRLNPFGGPGEFHEGMDFAGPYGSPIYATGAGQVETAENAGGYGHHIVINHGYGYQTLYAHLAEIMVMKGEKVQRDQLIGYMGNSGRSTGTHLHYSVFYQKKAIDPQPFVISGRALANR